MSRGRQRRPGSAGPRDPLLSAGRPPQPHRGVRRRRARLICGAESGSLSPQARVNWTGAGPTSDLGSKRMSSVFAAILLAAFVVVGLFKERIHDKKAYECGLGLFVASLMLVFAVPQVIVVGAAVCIEIWQPERWSDYVGQEMPAFRRLLEQLAG